MNTFSQPNIEQRDLLAEANRVQRAPCLSTLTRLTKISIRTAFAVGLFANSISMVHAQANVNIGERAPINIENSTQEKWLGQYAADKAPKEIYELFQSFEGLAMLARAYTFNFETSKVCVAEVGLTYAPSNPKQNPRLPKNIFWGASSGNSGMSTDGEDGCNSKALKRAIDGLFSENSETLRMGIDITADTGGTRTPKLKDDSQISANHMGMSDVGFQYLADAMPKWYSKVFDYRNVHNRFVFQAIDTDQGKRVCFAQIGLTSSNPDNRRIRYPSASISRARLLERAEADQAKKDSVCFDPLFNALIAQIEPNSDLVSNFISSWDAVSEPGLPRPSKKSIADIYARWNAEQIRVEKDRLKVARQQQRITSRPASASSTNRPRCINPATGFMMMATDGGCYGIDVMGNPYGMRNN